jgi:hypothetical protein
MNVLQSDFLGKRHSINKKKETERPERYVKKKSFRPITMHDGCDEVNAKNNAMMIHRYLQHKLSTTGLTTRAQNAALKRIFMNEMRIKSGTVNPITAVQDSLIHFFCM